MTVRLTVWDGAGVIGGNKVLLEADGRAIFLDFGTAFATADRYLGEFLQGRANRGVLDLNELDILPPLDSIYRPDLVPRTAPAPSACGASRTIARSKRRLCSPATRTSTKTARSRRCEGTSRSTARP